MLPRPSGIKPPRLVFSPSAQSSRSAISWLIQSVSLCLFVFAATREDMEAALSTEAVIELGKDASASVKMERSAKAFVLAGAWLDIAELLELRLASFSASKNADEGIFSPPKRVPRPVSALVLLAQNTHVAHIPTNLHFFHF